MFSGYSAENNRWECRPAVRPALRRDQLSPTEDQGSRWRYSTLFRLLQRSNLSRGTVYLERRIQAFETKTNATREWLAWSLIIHHHHHRLSSVFHATHRLDVSPQSSSSNSFSPMPTLSLVQETLRKGSRSIFPPDVKSFYCQASQAIMVRHRQRSYPTTIPYPIPYQIQFI